jgi:hypothetical protein
MSAALVALFVQMASQTQTELPAWWLAAVLTGTFGLIVQLYWLQKEVPPIPDPEDPKDTHTNT